MKKFLILAVLFVFMGVGSSFAQTVKTYYPNGKVKVAKSYFLSGKLEEIIVYYPNESKKFVKRYYSNGQLRGVIRYNNKDEQNGPYTYYWPNGQVKVKGAYKNGKHSGPTKEYSLTGVPLGPGQNQS